MRLRDIMPKSLFGRSLFIVGLPLIFLQIFLGYFFFERHWDDVGRRLVLAVAGEIALISDKIILAEENHIIEKQIIEDSANFFGAKIKILPNTILKKNELLHPKKTRLDRALSKSLKERIKFSHTFNTAISSNKVIIYVQLPNKVLLTEISKKRLYSSTTYIFIAVMLVSSLLLLSLAIFFLRRQISPLKELSNAADAFGKGDTFYALKPRGADEVRQVTHAFLDMRERIRLHIEQRTNMLAGVSHDLRTPLTRMKLQIEMLSSTEDKIGLKEDVNQMEQMLEAYLSFIKEKELEISVKSDLSKLVGSIILDAKRNDDIILPKKIETIDAKVRINDLRRAITNLTSNACRESKIVEISLIKKDKNALIIIDDNGPGIKKEDYTSVFKAFYRIENSRNLSTGGLGLGLTIARDIARSHGGEIKLDKSHLGGLKAILSIPI
ncbi:MAG: ATP-binding protein [Alphaproteobacteria bacterium]|tara:strand:+ start:582 stop:1898 length:1317 start_codon:yes stop_codon:yes gene_type:complete